MAAHFDLELAVRVLSELGLAPKFVREELSMLEPDADPAPEVAGLVLESDAGILFDARQALSESVVDLIDAFRRAGVACWLDSADGAPVLIVEHESRARAHRLNLEGDLTHEGMVEAVVRLLPAGFTIRLCPRCVQDGAYPVAVLSRDELEQLRTLLGEERLGEVLPPPPPARVHAHVAAITLDALDPVDWNARYAQRPTAGAAPAWEPIWARLRECDPRVAWSVDAERPPGDDFYALTAALCGEPLRRCLEHADRATWANLLYRWALATLVGAHWDLVACRLNPGTSAQGVLGLGQLSWAYFVFEAMGASDEASRTWALLQQPWIRDQERNVLTVRQHAWYDLAAFLRTGEKGPQLGRLREFVLLSEPGSWEQPELLEVALKVHSEPRGDQFTHHPLYFVWPAPLYALARRADAMDRLPASNPFVAHPVHVDDVVMQHELVARLHELGEQLDAVEAGGLPALLDPLPVIVDAQVTKIDGDTVHGRTVTGEAAEHLVQGPVPERSHIEVGQVWSFHVDGSRRAVATLKHGDDAPLRYRIAVPTGQWLEPND